MDLELAGLLALLFLSYVLPIALGLFGAFHLDDCPQQPLVPIYLGIFGLLIAAARLPYLNWCDRRTDERPALRSLLKVGKVVIFLVLLCWFIAGSVWIYSIYPPNYDSSGTHAYCGKTVYLIAFWFTNICYMAIAAALAFGLYSYVKNDCDQNICSYFRSSSYTPLT